MNVLQTVLPTAITVGSDPELFVINKQKAISAYQALGGDHEYVLPYGLLVPDGAAVEFTVTPTNDPKELAYRVYENTQATERIVRNRYPDAVLSNIPWINVQHLIRSHPKKLGNRCSLQVFGCNPDFSIYGTHLQRPDPAKFAWRSSGGHIHLGLHEVTQQMRFAEQDAYVRKVVVLLDTFIGTATTFGSALPEAKERKTIYGQAGVIRTTKMPVLEYRTPTAQLLTTDLLLTTLVFRVAQECAIAALRVPEEHLYELAIGVSKAIDTHDQDACRHWYHIGMMLVSQYQDIDAMSDLYQYLTQHPMQETIPFATMKKGDQ